MHAVSVSGLKNNPARPCASPSRHGRRAQQGPSDAVDDGASIRAACCRHRAVRAALATALFRGWVELSLARAARVAEMDTSAFISHLSRLGIPVIRLTEAETNARP